MWLIFFIYSYHSYRISILPLLSLHETSEYVRYIVFTDNSDIQLRHLNKKFNKNSSSGSRVRYVDRGTVGRTHEWPGTMINISHSYTSPFLAYQTVRAQWFQTAAETTEIDCSATKHVAVETKCSNILGNRILAAARSITSINELAPLCHFAKTEIHPVTSWYAMTDSIIINDINIQIQKHLYVNS